MEQSETPLHAKIEQMLTEARVILPGSQAVLGFQMIVMLTPAFAELPRSWQYIHIAALLSSIFSVVLLISPAAVHRLSFDGRDAARMHTIGSTLVTIALAPLAISISLEFYVALYRIFDAMEVAGVGALIALFLMLGHWYVLPLFIRHRIENPKLKQV